MISFRVDKIVAYPFHEKDPGPVAQAGQRLGVALSGLGILAGVAGLLGTGRIDWLVGLGVTLGLAGLYCFGAVRFLPTRDPRKLYAGKRNAPAGQTEAKQTYE
ncbi:MAG: hypothetical protein ACR2II_08015 [Chthoniobacterales bacterium]